MAGIEGFRLLFTLPLSGEADNCTDAAFERTWHGTKYFTIKAFDVKQFAS